MWGRVTGYAKTVRAQPMDYAWFAVVALVAVISCNACNARIACNARNAAQFGWLQ
jgi:hypothetical protein